MSDKRRILIIDDDKELSMLIQDMLEDNGYEVDVANSVFDAYSLLQGRMPHLILLDINLPDATGFEMCRELRGRSDVPIIFASARTSEDDKVDALDMGGDDYLAKPYSLKELLSRINSLLRRSYGRTTEKKYEEMIIGNHKISVDRNARIVSKDGVQIECAPREYDLLMYLMDNRGRALTKDELINNVWGSYSEVEQSTLTVHIRWLREKFETNPSNPQVIKTVWGVGYMMGE